MIWSIHFSQLEFGRCLISYLINFCYYNHNSAYVNVDGIYCKSMQPGIFIILGASEVMPYQNYCRCCIQRIIPHSEKSRAKKVPQWSRFGKWLLFAKRSHFTLKKGQKRCVKELERDFFLGKTAPLRKKRSQNSATKGSVLRIKTVLLRSHFGSSFFLIDV